jgi:rare lipoprotein A
MRRKGGPILIIAISLVAATGCHHRFKNSRLPSPPAAPGAGYAESGTASWYGHPYHGRRAANGEIYDMEKLTAAHRTLPFETWVRVTNLKNDKAVEVRINDRGPFVGGRIIDLSHAAARAIDMIGPGTAPVRLEVISSPPGAQAAYGVQVGSFRNRENAEKLRAELGSKYGATRLVLRPGNPDMWRLLVGAEPSQAGAAALAKRINEDSFERIAGFVVRIDE